jgi:hypothetical protein
MSPPADELARVLMVYYTGIGAFIVVSRTWDIVYFGFSWISLVVILGLVFKWDMARALSTTFVVGAFGGVLGAAVAYTRVFSKV